MVFYNMLALLCLIIKYPLYYSSKNFTCLFCCPTSGQVHLFCPQLFLYHFPEQNPPFVHVSLSLCFDEGFNT